MMEAGRHGDQGCVATADLNSEFESFYNVIPGHQALEGKKLTQLTSVCTLAVVKTCERCFTMHLLFILYRKP